MPRSRINAHMILPKVGVFIEDRFKVIRCQYQMRNLALFEGLDTSASTSVHVTITNEQTIIAKLQALLIAAQTCEKLQPILAIGRLGNTGSYYMITQNLLSEDYLLLPNCVTSLKLEQKISIIVDLCSILSCLHAQGIVLEELTPDLILMNSETLKMQALLIPPLYSFSSIPAEYLIEITDSPLRKSIELIPSLQFPEVQSHIQQLKIKNGQLEGAMYALLNPCLLPRFASPEFDADLFSLGVLIYWLFVQKLPFDEATGILEDKPLSFVELQFIWVLEYIYLLKLQGIDPKQVERIPEELHSIIERATDGTSAEKYKNAQNVLEDLMKIRWKVIKVYVRDEFKSPLDDIEVVIERENPDSKFSPDKFVRHSDRYGCVTLSNLLSGRYWVEVQESANHQKSLKVMIDVAKDSREIEVVLQRISLIKRVGNLWSNLHS